MNSVMQLHKLANAYCVIKCAELLFCVVAPSFNHKSLFAYSCNKIRKKQNEHLIIVCQNLIGL